MGSATGPFVRCFSMTVVPPFVRNPMMTLGGGPPSTFNAQRDNPSIDMSRWLRADWSREERKTRIAPVIQTLSSVQEDQDIVITDLSVVFQVFGGPGTKV